MSGVLLRLILWLFGFLSRLMIILRRIMFCIMFCLIKDISLLVIGI